MEIEEMSGQENEDIGFQHQRSDSFLNNCPSSVMSSNPMHEKISGMAMTSLSIFKPSNGPADPFFGSGWDTLCSLGQSENFGGSSSMVSQGGDFCNPQYNHPVLESHGMGSTVSHLVPYPSDPSFSEIAPKLSCFGSGGFSDMAGSFGFPHCSAVVAGQSQDGVLGSSPYGKRRKRLPDSNSPLSCDKNAEEEHKKDVSAEISEVRKEQDEKKLKVEEDASGNISSKQSGKQAKDNSNSEEPSKDNYIHVRARRGQATNSHSLAERVRREKISERMRLLQELVPGCNKITGKAVMLDEIINYVQSLQQQVEFLSMKLATVNPELNIDIERLLSKDILNTRGSAGAIFGLSPGIGSSQHFPLGMLNGTIPNIPNVNPHFSSLPPSVLDNELQGLLHMGFDTNSVIDNLGTNGRLKPEL